MKKKTIQDIEAGEIIYKITKPDLEDNLKKGMNDAMTGIVWTDDSRIAIGKGRKIYGTVPKIRIKVFTGLRTE
jgi:Holliday junction resolvase RusA-like endonuclease